jgi:hypothetical protein
MDRYRISQALPLEDQRIMVEARSGTGLPFVQVTLFVDDDALRTFARPPYRAWWALQPGEHQVSAVGETSDGRQISSEIVTVVVVK